MPPQKSRWTILIYIAAHNNLFAWGQGSLKRILSVGSTQEVKLAVLYDGFGAKRMIAGPPGEAPLEEALGRFDSGDPQALVDTARWAFEQCPAERYGLVLWSHGSGWQPENKEQDNERGGSSLSNWSEQELTHITQEIHGIPDKKLEQDARQRSAQAGSMTIFRTSLKGMLASPDSTERAICFDDGSGHSLDTLALEHVTGEIQSIIGQPLDLLGMDACVMSTLEVAYQLRKHVRYLVASEELVPAKSWPYESILATLRDAPDMPTSNLAALVVRQYVDYYTANPPRAGDVTKVALDLAHMDEIATTVDGLAGALLDDIQQQAVHLWQAQRTARERETQNGQRRISKFDFHLWDLGALVASLTTLSQNADVRRAAQAVSIALRVGNAAVVAEGHQGGWFDGIGGVSIYAVPPGTQRISPHYAKVALAQETRWSKMLAAYHGQFP